MRVILILGAGRSASSLISYLLNEAEKNNWRILVGDFMADVAQSRIGNAARGNGIAFNIHDPTLSRSIIAQADVVISLLPPHLHVIVAGFCLDLKKHLLTASYVSPEMRTFDQAAQANDLLFLNECGLDPGIDHMSAMQVIDKIKADNGKLLSFQSFTGGLIAPGTDPENPWRYKFTWNPRNVVTAGQATAKFLLHGKYKYIPYQQLFNTATTVHIKGHGTYEGYANRDSLSYIDTYGLEGVETMLRGTLRHHDFCKSWNVFVQLGCCDDTYLMEGVSTMTHSDFVEAFLLQNSPESTERKLIMQMHLDPDGPELRRLRWSGFFDSVLVGLDKGTPAQILEHILAKKWKLNVHDKDLIVMYHHFVYVLNGKTCETRISLAVEGDDAVHTAMARTVGLPLGIAAKLLMQGKINRRGVAIPIYPEFYDPILSELKLLGVELFEE
jgi:saccharopine dehydrogenase (NADP+, L-glutamate forming)